MWQPDENGEEIQGWQSLTIRCGAGGNFDLCQRVYDGGYSEFLNISSGSCDPAP
jgi:hypothetical protein